MLVAVPESNCDDITHLDLDEEDFDLLRGETCWYAYLKPGPYLLNLRFQGYLELNKELNVTSS